MRDPNNQISIYELSEPPAIIKMHDIPPYNLYDFDLNDDKSFAKYIMAIKKCVRESFEYRTFVQYLREYMDMHQCAFYEHVSNADSTKIRIEIHHEPLCLEDICRIVYNKRVAFNETLDEEWVAKEVMYLHYELMVGLIPLSETIHELVHGKYIFIPTTAVFGKYREFVDRYRPYMLPEQLEALENIEEATKTYDGSDAKAILSKNFIYIDTDEKTATTEEVAGMVKNRIRDLLDKDDKNTSTIKTDSSI